MKKTLRYIVGKTYRPLLIRYLGKTRSFQYDGIRLEIPPDVFHPGFFFSTKLLISYLRTLPLKGRSFLELGAGSGLISVFAERQGAMVTATDINPGAIRTLEKNRSWNKASFEIIQSDLFEKMAGREYDVIAINPPYYTKQPQQPSEYAWYCGENGEYFERLFRSVKDHVKKNAVVLMILCDGCDIQMIGSFAAASKIDMVPVLRKKNLLEENIIYRLDPAHD